MKKIACVCAVAASVLAGPAQAVVIDFSDLPVNTILTDQFADQGVVFSAYENGLEVPMAVINYHTLSGYGNYLGNTTNNLADLGKRHDVVRLDFARTLESLALDVYGHGGLEIGFKAYGLDGEVLETLSVFAYDGFKTVSFSALGITRLEVFQPTDSWLFALDNIHFELTAPQTEVPEPAALGLLGLGMLGVAGLRRRKPA